MARAASPEGRVKKHLKERLAELGVLNTQQFMQIMTRQEEIPPPHGWYYMPATNGYGESGVWDFVGVWNGKFFAIETKAGSNTLSPHQRIKGNIFVMCGALRYVVASIDEAKDFCFEESPQFEATESII